MDNSSILYINLTVLLDSDDSGLGVLELENVYQFR